jgi:hypothetical protein
VNWCRAQEENACASSEGRQREESVGPGIPHVVRFVDHDQIMALIGILARPDVFLLSQLTSAEKPIGVSAAQRLERE